MTLLRRAAAAAPMAGFGLAAVLLARDFPPIPGQAYGPALFPTALGILLLAAAILVALQQPPMEESPPVPLRGRVAALACAVAPLAVILGFEALGWPLLAFGLGTILLLLAGARPLTALLAALGVAALTWMLFAMLLRVPLPRGPLSFLPY